MLTPSDRIGPPWLIVGTRPDGDRLVIDQALRRAEAEQLARLYREQLDGYKRIDVERIGEVTGPCC